MDQLTEGMEPSTAPAEKRNRLSMERIFARRALARERIETLLRTWEEEREEVDRVQLGAYHFQFEQILKETDEYNEIIQEGMAGVALGKERSETG